MTDRRQAKDEPGDLEHVRTWIEDVRTVLCILALIPRRHPGLAGAVASQCDALARVLHDLDALPRHDTGAAFHAASAAHAGAQVLLTLATGDGDVAEPGDGAWWLAHATWLIGKAQEHVMTANAHARRPGRPPGKAPTKERIQKAIAERPTASHKEVADAVYSSPEYVRKVRRRRT